MKSANQRVDDLNPFNDIKPLDMMGILQDFGSNLIRLLPAR